MKGAALGPLLDPALWTLHSTVAHTKVVLLEPHGLHREMAASRTGAESIQGELTASYSIRK